jgi:hypothetical protein
VALDLYIEELPRELIDMPAGELSAAELTPEMAFNSSLGTFTSVSSFTCPYTTLGTFSTASTAG